MSNEVTNNHSSFIATPKTVRAVIESFAKNPEMKDAARARLLVVDIELIRDIRKRTLEGKQLF